LIVQLLARIRLCMAEAAYKERPKAKAVRAVTRRGPTPAQLRRQAERAEHRTEGPDLGKMSHEERNKLLFGV